MRLKQYRILRKYLIDNLEKKINTYEHVLAGKPLHQEEMYELNRDRALLYRLVNRGLMPKDFKVYIKCLIDCNFGSWRSI